MKKKSSTIKVNFNKVTYYLSKNRTDCFKFSLSANKHFAFLPVLPNISICSVRNAERYWREGGVMVCGDAVLRKFLFYVAWGIAALQVQSVCGI